jgi:hypothetical protein
VSPSLTMKPPRQVATMFARAILSCTTPAVVVACGGGPSAQQEARIRAANEFHCPMSDVSTRVVSGPTVRVSACGHEATYTCPPEYYGRGSSWTRSCIREASDGALTPSR